MEHIGIVACSDAQKISSSEQNNSLVDFLKSTGRFVFLSGCIYEKENIFSGSGKEKADELMKLFKNPEITEIYDISGGDMANEILDYLDFSAIKNSRATYWGYSDLTTVINAIYTMTGKSSVLYQIRNLCHDEFKNEQRERYLNRADLFNPKFEFVSGESLKGVVVGGNIRCFLKLAGTKYFPDFKDKILLLESFHGKASQMITYLSQLKSCGVFEKINGIILGTFTQMEEEKIKPDIVSMIKRFVKDDMPIAKTNEIGHGYDSKAIYIGKEINLHK